MPVDELDHHFGQRSNSAWAASPEKGQRLLAFIARDVADAPADQRQWDAPIGSTFWRSASDASFHQDRPMPLALVADGVRTPLR